MEKGNINIQAENIFPIIKKFLYTDQEIFIRELISNAVDATQKMKTLKTIGELKTDISKLRVEVILNTESKTKLSLPIIEAVYNVLYAKRSAKKTFKNLSVMLS